MDVKKIMLLEDNKNAQVLLKRQIYKFAPKSILTVADNKPTFLKKINWFFHDLIVSDFNLLGFSGLEALLYVREHKPYIPFVFITGELPRNNCLTKKVLEVADGFFFKDDLTNLHVELKKIMEIKAAKASKSSQFMKDQNKLKLSITKALQLVQTSDEFSNKEELLKLLKSGME